MVGTTQCVLAQQVRSTFRRQHQFLPQVEQETPITTLWVRWNSAAPATNTQRPSEAWTTVHASNLAWQRHSIRRNTPRHCQQGHPSKNHPETTTSGKVQQAVDGRHQQQRTSKVRNRRTSAHTTTCFLQATEAWANDSGDTDTWSTTNNHDNHIYITYSITASTSVLTNGNIPDQLPHQTSTSVTNISKQTIFQRWDRTRLRSQTTTNRHTNCRTSTAWNSSRTTKHKATSCTDFSSHNSNKERNTHYSTVLWGPNRSHHWTHSPRTNRQQHRRIGQTENNRGNEERDWTNEGTTSVPWSELQHTHTGTAEEHHSVSMGSQRQRQHSASTHCSKRIHRNNIRHGWHLRINTNFLCTPIASHTQHQQRLDHPNRRHLRGIPARTSSNIGSLHVSTNRVLHNRFWSDLETQQSNLWIAQQSKSMASTPGRNTSTTRPTQKHSRAQCLLHNITRLLHPRVCGPPDVPGCGQHDQQDLRRDPTTSHAEINRHIDAGQHRRFSGVKHHQHGRSLRN